MIKLLIPLIVSTILSGNIEVNDNVTGVIGVRINSFSHKISKVFEGSPADIAGFKEDDKVLGVTDVDGNKEADIKGPPGTTIMIKVERRICNFCGLPFKDCPAAVANPRELEGTTLTTLVVTRVPWSYIYDKEPDGGQ